jgi:hypothetical protein
MTNRLEDEVQHIVASLDNEQNSQEQEEPETTGQEKEPAETIHIHFFPDAIVIVKEEAETQVVDSTPAIPQKTSLLPAYAVCSLYLLLIVSTLVFQLYWLFNPPIATITIQPKTQTVTLTGTLQLGRVLPPLTISQSQTVPTTGKGHQDARSATGFIAFYNGLFTSQTIAQGTILTGTDGIQIVTDQDAYVPPESQTIPPTLGHITVPAHAGSPGEKGNIPTGTINQGCCAPSILAQNTAPFHGGQNERDFSTVSLQDINKISTPLKTTLSESMQGAMQGQLTPTEQLSILPCSPTVTSDHSIEQEAATVKVTVSDTCSAVAYNREELEQKATDYLSRQAATKTGTSYSLLGGVQVSVNQATISHTTTPLVFITFQAQGTWVYALSQEQQQQIKLSIAGKTAQEALQLLASQPGIERVSIDYYNTKLPKDSANIHINLFAS